MTAVCLDIAGGDLVKRSAKRHGVAAKTIREWRDVDAVLGSLYERARIDQAHAMAEDTIDIADGIDEEGEKRLVAFVGAISGVDENTKGHILNALATAAVQRDRLRVDTRKWLTAKVAPKLYGDKLTHDVEPGGTLAELIARATRPKPG